MVNKRDIQNLNGLLFLSVLHEYRSKKRTAEIIGSSVDTLNKYLYNLEDYFGEQLVTSSEKGCQLTAKGVELLSEIDLLREKFTSICERHIQKNTFSGEVHVCIPLTASTNLFPCRWDDFFDKYSDIKIILFSSLEMLSPDVLGVDVGITYFQPKATSNVVEICSKFVECGFFASKEYVKRHGVPKDLNDMLANHRLVNKINSQFHVQMWRKYLEQARCVCIESNSTLDLMEAIKSGAGIGIMPLRFKKEGLVLMENIKCESHLSFYLVANPKTKDIPRVRAVIDFLRPIVENM